MKILNEGLDYLDMVDQIDDTITIDEYAAKMGKDSDIVTVTFTVHSELAADDLVSWLERGYDFILDASVSEGELEPGKFLVFAELNRRSTVPDRICKILSDLETLTDIKLEDWTVIIDDDEHDADPEVIKDSMILNPNLYREEHPTDEEEKGEEENADDEDEEDTEEMPPEPTLNEFRNLAGLESPPVLVTNDEYILNLKSMAGL